MNKGLFLLFFVAYTLACHGPPRPVGEKGPSLAELALGDKSLNHVVNTSTVLDDPLSVLGPGYFQLESPKPLEAFSAHVKHRVTLSTESGGEIILSASDVIFEIHNNHGLGMRMYRVSFKNFYSSYMDLFEAVVTLQQRVKQLEQE